MFQDVTDDLSQIQIGENVKLSQTLGALPIGSDEMS